MAINNVGGNLVNLQNANNNSGKSLVDNSAAKIANQALNVALSASNGKPAEVLKGLGDLFQSAGNLLAKNKDAAVAQPPLPSSISKLFGNSVLDKLLDQSNQQGGTSLGALLAQLGSILGKALETTMSELAKNAKQLDKLTTAGGPTAAMNQKIQEMTFTLQQVQQTVNRINETVTGLSRSQSDTQKTFVQNLTV